MNTPLFLTFHNTYTDIMISLYDGPLLLNTITEHHKEASKTLVTHIQCLLDSQHKALKDCSFIAAHIGPGPFTTLRAVISSVNGLAYASNIPLVGVDGLTTFIDEYHVAETTTIALLNAFCEDVYYAIRTSTTMIIGCSAINEFLDTILPTHVAPAASIRFIGNAVIMYKSNIINRLQQPFIILDPLPSTCSVNAVALTALKQWHDKSNVTTQLLPNYLKNSSSKISPAILTY